MTKAARALGISTGTLHAARKRLGVATAKDGFSGGWTWQLPKMRDAAPSLRS